MFKKRLILSFIFVNSLLLLFSILILNDSSFESFPTEEQEEKKSIVFGLFFFVFFIIEIFLIFIYSKLKSQKLSSKRLPI
ncbi:MAG TPA: hypothetical protein PK079_20025 [Leptospiraceae bacterium]|nr:hypothetical protein [Leptospiraceae bacterium]HMW08271.1 hypothetical protein [Leptospiraceae bacterium]HMX35146.1 hypothetical protein [Leptospiraceae bacterium]HMY34037.1 hypothetical protein [Leptospiraceae bacterium]HMZ67150.1 hypothetical protein [Leptospiraceae bacterium]